MGPVVQLRSPTQGALAAVLALGATVGALVLLGRDLEGEQGLDAATSSLVGLRSPGVDAVTATVSFLTGTVGIPVLTAVVALIAWARWRRWREPLLVGVAEGTESLLYLVTTLLVGRERPPVSAQELVPPTSSFPSGHVAATATLAGMATVLLAAGGGSRAAVRLAVFATVAATTVAGLARVVRGMHWPTDAIGGAVLGAATLGAVVVTATAMGRRPGGEPCAPS